MDKNDHFPVLQLCWAIFNSYEKWKFIENSPCFLENKTFIHHGLSTSMLAYPRATANGHQSLANWDESSKHTTRRPGLIFRRAHSSPGFQAGRDLSIGNPCQLPILGWKESNFPEENPQINQAAMREIEVITVNTVVVLHADHSVLLSMKGFPTLFPSGNLTWQLDTGICR